ncbi:uncharacterized protein PRCAT00001356001 [Priceomyces carsonii]|uniref:uncharacterized protein n=1 Tax=Priceomyces carsonii TaxID=28549 RepID=UPI002ED9AEEA|nr:unnamed protein product [Priceomyces carsonii]
MESFRLPLDFKASPSEKGHGVELKISSKGLRISKDFEKLKKDIKQSPNDLRKWDLLFEAFNDKFEELYGEEKDKNITTEFKRIVDESYLELLDRFPLLVFYWKNWLILAYKLDGIEASINVLEKSVVEFPYSIELWVDYLSALISDFKLGKDDEGTLDQKIQNIRNLYTLALRYNGKNFNSHVLWDKAISFESEVDSNSHELLSLYLDNIRTPLYQYAQYFKQFSEINKNYKVEDIVPESELQDYIIKFQGSNIDDLSEADKFQIIDDYSYKVFNETQKTVDEKWQYESSLMYQDFSLDKIEEIEKEIGAWRLYLKYQVNKYSEEPNSFQFDLVCNLFERALIPNCFSSNLWMSFLSFLNFLQLNDQEKYEKMSQLYHRAGNRFLPLNDNILRFSYCDFLMKYDKFDMSVEYLFDLIKMFSGSLDPKGVYLKKPYLESINKLIELWKQKMNQPEYSGQLCTIIFDYFSVDEKSRKSRHSKDPTIDNKEDSYKFNENYVRILQKLLNSDSICIITDLYIDSLNQSSESATEEMRHLFNNIFQENEFTKSVKFWKKFIEFEGLKTRSMINLIRIVTYMSCNTQLPKVMIDALIDLSYDILLPNLADALEMTPETREFLLYMDASKSNSLFINSYLRRRMSKFNFYLGDVDDKRITSSKHRSVLREENLLKLAKKHFDHPGIITEAVPEVTNSIMNDKVKYPLESSRLEIPPLPTFKNVEKASLPINYPTE